MRFYLWYTGLIHFHRQLSIEAFILTNHLNPGLQGILTADIYVCVGAGKQPASWQPCLDVLPSELLLLLSPRIANKPQQIPKRKHSYTYRVDCFTIHYRKCDQNFVSLVRRLCDLGKKLQRHKQVSSSNSTTKRKKTFSKPYVLPTKRAPKRGTAVTYILITSMVLSLLQYSMMFIL